MRDMSVLSMMEARLPPGFRFHPRDEELVCDYLERRISGYSNGSSLGFPTIIDVDLNQCEPWDLPEMACVGGKVWFFYSLRDRKYATGQRTNRSTQSGYWKATGKDRPVMRKGKLVGMRKTLVFYQGRAPKGKKTNWVMHEFRLETSAGDSPNFSTKEDWVLCRVSFKGRITVPNPPSPTLPAMTTSDPFNDYNCSSSSLPPLRDSYISFDHPHGNHHQTHMSLQGYEQVPCFSSPLASGQPTAPPLHPAAPNLASQLMNPMVYNCDRKMIQAFFRHFTKVDGAVQMEASMGLDDGAIERYLSPEDGSQNMW